MDNKTKVKAAAIAKEEGRTLESVMVEINTKRTLGAAAFKAKKKKLKSTKASRRANR